MSEEASASVYERCVQQIATHFNVTPSQVREIISKHHTNNCKSGEVWFEGRCVKTKIPDLDAINRDPFKWLETHLRKTSELHDFLRYVSFLYYNVGTDLSDVAYEALEYEYNKRIKNKAQAKLRIGAPAVEKIRVTLPYTMPSLSKIKPNEKGMLAFLESARTRSVPIVYSHKLDGVSCMIVYKDGDLDGMYTSAAGVEGGDVTYLSQHIIGVPQEVTHPYANGVFVVRGELIISREAWKKYAHQYAMARNFVVSHVNSGSLIEGVEDIEFIAYEVKIWGDVNTPRPSPSKWPRLLRKAGFECAVGGVFDESVTVFDIMMTYVNARETSAYNIDGLVLTLDVESTYEHTAEPPTHAVAFKMTTEDQLRTTTVLDVEWRITRHGLYFPVAVFEPVFIEGIRFKHASALSGKKCVKEWGLGRGSIITIRHSGDVIPQIDSVVKDARITPILPGDEWEWKWLPSGANITLVNIDDNQCVQIARILHFYETLSVRGFGPKTAENLWKYGFTSPHSIAHASVTELSKIPRMQAAKIYDAIHTSLAEVKLDRLMIATTVFKSHVKRTVFKDVIKMYPDILDASSSEIEKMLSRAKLPNVKAITINKLAEGIPKFRQFLRDLDDENTTKAIQAHIARVQSHTNDPRIEGRVFVLTGFLQPDLDLDDFITDNGGRIAGIVTAETTAVVCKMLGGVPSTKMKDAYNLGVKVLSLDEFRTLFL